MIAIPAVDIRAGACVQLAAGSLDREVLRIANPAGVADAWFRFGFTRVHLIDMDAVAGRGCNARVIDDILSLRDGEVQAGGGVRDDEAAQRLFDAGATCVVVGTRALEDIGWMEELAHSWPGEIIVAVDVRDRRITTQGAQRMLPRLLDSVIEELNPLPLAAILVTAVEHEGRMQGTDLPLMEDAVEVSVHPVIASGGITTLNDLRSLESRGVSGAVIGMALYSGVLDARTAASEFGGAG